MFNNNTVKFTIISINIFMFCLFSAPGNIYALMHIKGKPQNTAPSQEGNGKVREDKTYTSEKAINNIREEKRRILEKSAREGRLVETRPFEAKSQVEESDDLLKLRLKGIKWYGIAPGKGATKVLIFLVIFCAVVYFMYRSLLPKELQ